jgi:hypothetical protein
MMNAFEMDEKADNGSAVGIRDEENNEARPRVTASNMFSDTKDIEDADATLVNDAEGEGASADDKPNF